MVFVKHNSLKSDILFNPIFIPGFSGSRFFRAQVFQGPGFSGSRFFRVRVQGPGPESRVRVWVQGPGSRFRVQGSGPRSRLRVQVLEVAIKNGSCYKKAKISHEAVSNTKFDTDDVRIWMSFQNFCLNFMEFHTFSLRF